MIARSIEAKLMYEGNSKLLARGPGEGHRIIRFQMTVTEAFSRESSSHTLRG